MPETDQHQKWPNIRVGCAGLPSGLRRGRYFERLGLLESDALVRKPPKPAVLRKWRKECGPKAAFSLVASPVITDPARGTEAGCFRATDIVRAAVTQTLEAAELLAAETILFRTPPSFTPSSANREAMQRFFTTPELEAARRDHSLVWEPQGLWEPETAAAIADKLAIVLALDPGSADQLELAGTRSAHTRYAYLRVSGMGSGRRRTPAHRLAEILEVADAAERAWILFVTQDKLADATAMSKLLADRAAETS